MDELIGKYVVILDHHRDITGGKLESYSPTTKTAVLTEMRIVWSYLVSKGDGVGGLAAHGPLAGTRIGATIERGIQEDCCRVLLCSPEAEAAWRTCKWG